MNQIIETQNIEAQIYLVVNAVRCIHLKKVLATTTQGSPLNFWRLLSGGFMDLSVIEWTKIFGTNTELTHWTKKGVISDHDQFRKDLLKHVGCTELEWANYWTHMKSYRDKFAAHHDADTNVLTYPVLDLALKSCYFYYATLIAKFRDLGGTRFPDDLEVYCNDFSLQATKIANAAFTATSPFEESVR